VGGWVWLWVWVGAGEGDTSFFTLTHTHPLNFLLNSIVGEIFHKKLAVYGHFLF
jgi:hypothetical protein